MRVLHVTQTTATGVAHVLEDHLRHQASLGWDVVVASPRSSQCSALPGGVRWCAWSATRSPGASLPREVAALRRIVGEVRPDLVHLHSAKAGLAGRLAIRGAVPTVFTPHAWSWLASGRLVGALALRWERHAVRHCDAIVCVSEDEWRLAEDSGVSGPLRVIPNDAPVDRLRELAPDSMESARRQLGLPLDVPVAVCCARLSPQKGQDVLLRAWRRLSSDSAVLVLVGDGPMRAELDELARTAGDVRLVGMRSREAALAWMVAATVVVCPSNYEGMSLVPLEAAALGRPVVACEVEGMRSELSSNARMLVPPGDDVALAAALDPFLRDAPRAAAGGVEAAEWADRTQREQGAAQANVALYREILAARTGRPPS